METEPNNNQTVPEEIESPHINENYTEIVFNESLINNNEKNQLEQTAENVAEMVTVLGPEDSKLFILGHFGALIQCVSLNIFVGITGTSRV